MNKRRELSSVLIKEFNLPFALEDIITYWWVALAESSPSLQLSSAGFYYISKLINHWKIEYDGFEITSQVILSLSRLPCPWYLTHDGIILFGGKEAFSAKMQGSFEKWYQSIR